LKEVRSTAISFKKEQTYKLHDKKKEDYIGKNKAQKARALEKNKQSSRSTDKTDMKKNHSSGCALPQAKSRSRISSIIKARICGGVAAAPSNTRRLRSFQMFQAV
jgi:hypothetical protein